MASADALAPLYRAADAVSRWPGVDGFLRRRYERLFRANRDANLFRGVYATWEEALAAVPSDLPTGYDNPASANMYLERTRRTHPTDYPVMFWLQRLFSEGAARVFDLGGHVGVSYYAYRRHLQYPDRLEWRVHDVPAVMSRGRELAAQRDAERRLSFSDDFSGAEGCDVLTAQGSLQYLPDTLAARLARLASPPRHLLVNLMPLHETLGYYTVQGLGTAFCPYRIAAAGEFLASFEPLGYRLVDTWENPDKRCHIPFHPSHSLDRYHGFHFRREP
jgi:putative methyltransferase (TIGR04325 family)